MIPTIVHKISVTQEESSARDCKEFQKERLQPHTRDSLSRMDAFGGLTPSQTIRSSSGGNSTATATSSGSGNANANSGNTENGTNAGKSRGRRNNKKKKAGAAVNATANGENISEGNAKKNNQSKTNAASNQEPNGEGGGMKAKKRSNKNSNNRGKNKNGGSRQEGAAAKKNANQSDDNTNDNVAKKNANKNKSKRNRKKCPWRKDIPAGSMDPITLEDLATLPYPPFALRASSPFIPAEWPIPKEPDKTANHNNNSNKKNGRISEDSEEEVKERERRLLQEQWGQLSAIEDTPKVTEEVFNPAHVNLFDGRALAYYMVSQLQFIDPLNRRDLSRDELCHLDRYLVRNGFHDLNVVEAYDTKGVSLSTAGAASTTAAGRVEILQQEAQNLLNALFGRGPTLPTSNNRNNSTANNNPLMQQYSNYQAAQEQYNQQSQSVRQSNQTGFFAPEDTGVYGGEDGEMMVIDDDLNPSLRGGRGLRPFRASGAGGGRAQNNTTLWSANRITGPAQGQATLQADNFPALSTVATMPTEQSALSSTASSFVPEGAVATSAPAPAPAAAKVPKKPLPKAKTLNFITKAVKKTKPEEAQRQFEAREEARRKALLSNLTFGSNPANWDAPTQASATVPASHVPTEGQLERNRAFADALGVSTVPQGTSAVRLTGWARSTTAGANLATYPDTLILKARENMGVLLKLEKRWKTFLDDDKAASLPLNKMDGPTRKFVHEYSDYWKLHTESFDPEPKRYIHCVKLLDTSSPYPLLSDAARRWRGPTGNVSSLEHASLQTAGQDTRGGEVTNSRAAALVPERPKLELKERTLPLELPPFRPPVQESEFVPDNEELFRLKQAREERKREEKDERELLKRRTLEAAFASDSEEERSLGEVDADVEWEQGEALYTGSDEEESA